MTSLRKSLFLQFHLLSLIVIYLLVARDPIDEWEESDSEEEGLEEATAAKVKPKKKGTKVDIDLGLSAYANATRLEPACGGGSPVAMVFTAGIMGTRNKQQGKSRGPWMLPRRYSSNPWVWLQCCVWGRGLQALKSAEKKAKQTLKEASKVAKILKARKVHWYVRKYPPSAHDP